MVCTKNCDFYRIEKRLLAIVITSFELEFQQKGKAWSEVNINSQIKGQNCTPEQELLLRNAERIRTTERKTRDLKLRSYAMKKSMKDQFDLVEREFREERNDRNDSSSHRGMSVEEKRRMIQTSDGRFRSTNIMKFINTFGGVMDQNKYDKLKKLNNKR